MDGKAFSSFLDYTNADPICDPSQGSSFPPVLSNEGPVSSTRIQLPSSSSRSSSTSTSSIRTEHQYCLANGNGKDNVQPWLTLCVSSRSPKPELLPLFFGKDSISGTVKLELTKPETMREMKVTVRVVFRYALQPTYHRVDPGRENSLNPRTEYLS